MFHVKHFKKHCFTAGFSCFYAVWKAFECFPALFCFFGFFKDFSVSRELFSVSHCFYRMFHVKHFDFLDILTLPELFFPWYNMSIQEAAAFLVNSYKIEVKRFRHV